VSKARWLHVLEKSIAAAVSAIEIYNKPDFRYREETFSVLMVNAWELLLKSKIVKDNHNDLRSIQIKEQRQLRDGSLSRRWYVRKNRSGNPITLSIGDAVKELTKYDPIMLNERLVQNLFLLVEIRDNSIHFVNKDIGLQSRLQEVGTACLKNYVEVVLQWFDYDLAQYNFYLMPLSFFHEADVIESFSVKKYNEQTRNLLRYLEAVKGRHPSDVEQPYNAALRIETKFSRSSSDDALLVRYTTDPNAPQVRITEEDAFRKYPFDYTALTEKLRARYTDFKSNQKYHDIRHTLKGNSMYCRTRTLDPSNPKSLKKEYFSSEVFRVFDQYYARKERRP
jgi:hypothetical protein